MMQPAHACRLARGRALLEARPTMSDARASRLTAPCGRTGASRSSAPLGASVGPSLQALMRNSRRNEAISITTAIAVASA